MNSWGTKVSVTILLLASLGVIAFQILKTQTLSTGEAQTKEQNQNGVSGPQNENSKAIFCSDAFEPVCGQIQGKEKSFVNHCEAEKAHALEMKDGLCSPEENCPKVYDPVCGIVEGNARDFNNLCLAETAGAIDIQPHRCPNNPDDVPLCPEMPGPVCGTLNGKKQSFENACAAQQAGAMEIQPNKCPLSTGLELSNTGE